VAGSGRRAAANAEAQQGKNPARHAGDRRQSMDVSPGLPHPRDPPSSVSVPLLRPPARPSNDSPAFFSGKTTRRTESAAAQTRLDASCSVTKTLFGELFDETVR